MSHFYYHRIFLPNDEKIENKEQSIIKIKAMTSSFSTHKMIAEITPSVENTNGGNIPNSLNVVLKKPASAADC